jgi:hypothetical protein
MSLIHTRKTSPATPVLSYTHELRSGAREDQLNLGVVEASSVLQRKQAVPETGASSVLLHPMIG